MFTAPGFDVVFTVLDWYVVFTVPGCYSPRLIRRVYSSGLLRRVNSPGLLRRVYSSGLSRRVYSPGFLPRVNCPGSITSCLQLGVWSLCIFTTSRFCGVPYSQNLDVLKMGPSVVVFVVVCVILLEPSMVVQMYNSWSAPTYKMIYCKVLIPMDSIALDVLGKGDKPFLCKCTRASGFPFVFALHNYRKPVYFSIIGLYSYSRTKRVFFQEAFKFIVLVSVGLWYR